MMQPVCLADLLSLVVLVVAVEVLVLTLLVVLVVVWLVAQELVPVATVAVEVERNRPVVQPALVTADLFPVTSVMPHKHARITTPVVAVDGMAVEAVPHTVPVVAVLLTRIRRWLAMLCTLRVQLVQPQTEA